MAVCSETLNPQLKYKKDGLQFLMEFSDGKRGSWDGNLVDRLRYSWIPRRPTSNWKWRNIYRCYQINCWRRTTGAGVMSLFELEVDVLPELYRLPAS